MILLAGVAKLPYDVWQTWTLSGTMVARSRALVGTEDVASTVLTILPQSVPVESRFAHLATGTVGVEQTLEAMAGVWIAVTGAT